MTCVYREPDLRCRYIVIVSREAGEAGGTQMMTAACGAGDLGDIRAALQEIFGCAGGGFCPRRGGGFAPPRPAENRPPLPPNNPPAANTQKTTRLTVNPTKLESA